MLNLVIKTVLHVFLTRGQITFFSLAGSCFCLVVCGTPIVVQETRNEMVAWIARIFQASPYSSATFNCH